MIDRLIASFSVFARRLDGASTYASEAHERSLRAGITRGLTCAAVTRW